MGKLLAGLLFFSLAISLHAQSHKRVDTVVFESAVLHSKAPFRIILPEGYDQGEERYPVLLLLHGFGDTYSAWTEKTYIVLYTRRYPLIIVMPDGKTGWYANGAGSGVRWEDYIMKDLVPYVDAHYRTLQDQGRIAVAGLSMGGYGAIKLGLKYHETFSFAASLSGVLGITDRTDEQMGKWGDEFVHSVHDAFGPAGSPARAANDPKQLLDIPAAEIPFLYVDWGTEDDLLPDSRRFSELLQAKHFPHEYRERTGVHDWLEWDHQIQEVLRVLAERWQLRLSVQLSGIDNRNHYNLLRDIAGGTYGGDILYIAHTTSRL